MSKSISQVVAEFFPRPTEGRDLSSQIQRLGDEIQKVIRSEGTMSGKFFGLLESFKTIIPDEKQRFQAVLQALSTTSRLSRQEIIQAVNGQLVELKIAENGLAPVQQSWRDALKGMEARSQQLKGEMEQLRARLTQLEGEEKAVRAGMAQQEKDLAGAEKTVKDLFANIGAEINSLNKKLLDLTSDAPSAQPVLQAVQPVPAAAEPAPQKTPAKNDAPAKKKKGSEQETGDEKAESAETKGAAALQDTKFRRKCPMCGGPFNLLELENIWQCYTCAYEEPNK